MIPVNDIVKSTFYMKPSEDQKTIELFDNYELTNEFKQYVCLPYLKDVYKDLSSRSDQPEKGIHKICFLNYVGLPGLIGERVFAVFDINKDGYLDQTEFATNMLKVYSNDFAVKRKLVFDMYLRYDFDRDGYITKEDVKLVLSYAPVEKLSGSPIGALKRLEAKVERGEEAKTPKTEAKEDFVARAESQKELNALTEACFKGKITLSCDDFGHIIDHIDSGMFLCLLCLLRTHFPTLDQFKRYDLAQKRAGKGLLRSSSMSRKLAAPKLLSKFSPVSGLAKSSLPRSSSFRNVLTADDPKGETPTKPKNKELPKSKFAGKTPISLGLGVKATDSPILPAIRLSNAKEASVDVTKSPTTFLASERREVQLLFCQCGRQISDFNLLQCDFCLKSENDLKFEGCLYTKSRTNGKLKKGWYVVEKKEMYCYEMQTDKTYKKMRSLVGCFIKEEPVDKIEDKVTVYPFTLFFSNAVKKRYYITDKGDYKKWCDTIKQIIGYSNLTDSYDIKEVLGKGKFGIVKAAVHKKTGRRVAVKMLKKSTMGEKDLELVRYEIETLKMCQHPNIIKLLDIFENVDYIYLVMEFLVGGDLFTYLERRKFYVPEAQARRIVHSLAAALFYLHSYGIVHRDIKPENIMMSDKGDNATVKIVDFGLAKMIGPSQFCSEPYGTLAYVAPEVLLQRPYGKAVDIWSLGVIAHLLLVGALPFDHEDDTVLAKMTIKAEAKYDSSVWKRVSSEGLDFVKGIIIKDPEKRMTLKEVLQHPWILKESKAIGEMRRNSLPAEAFEVFSLAQ